MITDAQRKAREAFDLDAAMAALPPDGPPRLQASHRGAAGVRLRACFVADVSDDLLREMARETFGAVRCSEQYLDALRIVLGNQADAERHGYTLEMNRRVDFAPEQVMRTIIDQMQAAGVCYGSAVDLGQGRRQLVQCFAGKRSRHMTSADELERMERQHEAADDARLAAALARGDDQFNKPNLHDHCRHIEAADVPY